jgi:hypothetical protein
MTQATWQLLTAAPNVPAAHVTISLLEGAGVACRLKTDSSLLGEARSCVILVEAGLLQRARRILAEASFTDAELDFLATGRHACDEPKQRP